MKYQARLVAPTANDKYWNHYTKGGVNKCILINGSSCLPNCVGYCWGRWYELLSSEPKLPRTNAETWFLNSTDGYSRGQAPKLGAVACWSSGSTKTGSDGCGHVAIVEKVNADGSIVVSESNYGGSRFRYLSLPKGYSYKNTKLKFQGFIYIPIEWDTDPVKEDTQVKPVYKIGSLYKSNVILNVRTSAGRDAKIKGYYELTSNARSNAYPPSDPKNPGRLKAGSFMTCLETKAIGDDIWMRIPSGWVCAYCKDGVYIS